MTVTCNVNPVRGTPVSEQRTLNVQCRYSVLTCVWTFFGSDRVHSHISLHKIRPLNTLNFGKRAIKVLLMCMIYHIINTFPIHRHVHHSPWPTSENVL